MALAFVANRTGLVTNSLDLARPREIKEDRLDLKALQALASARYADDMVHVLKSYVLGFVRLKARELAQGGLSARSPKLGVCHAHRRKARSHLAPRGRSERR